MKRILLCISVLLLCSGCAVLDFFKDVIDKERTLIKSVANDWSFEDGKLEIFSNIETGEYAYDEKPWDQYQDDIIEVVIHEGVSETDDYMFDFCSNIEKISLPDSLLKIGNAPFQQCWKLKEITLPSHLETIGFNAFCNCGIESIYIPASVNKIESALFYSSPNIKSIIVDNDNEVYSDFDCNVIVEKETMLLISGCSFSKIPEGIIEIDFAAFTFSSIKEVVFPNTLEIIGSNAFDSTEIEKLYIPASVQTLGWCCFQSNPNLEYVEFEYSDIPIQICYNSFNCNDKLETINFNGRPYEYY